MNLPYKRILVVCEGLTEYFYAKSLQSSLPRNVQRNFTVELDYDLKNEPALMVDKAIKKVQQANRSKVPYDVVWLFFDNDNRSGLDKVFNSISEHKFRFAYSSKCIEYWFLLHFIDCGREFYDCDETSQLLRKYWPVYHKTKINHFDFLREDLSHAIIRASHHRNNFAQELEIYQKNPFTNVDELVQFFAEFNNS